MCAASAAGFCVLLFFFDVSRVIKSRGSHEDAEHIIFALTRFWAHVDINRIQEDDMDRFVSRFPAAAPAWSAIKRRYGQ